MAVEQGNLLWASWEPKVANRFVMTLEGAGVPSYLVKVAARPQVSFGDVDIHYINQRRRFKGKAEWNDIELTLYDPVTSDGQQAVWNWLRVHHDAQTGVDGYAADYKKDVYIDTLAPDGYILETWTLHQAFINNVNFGATTFDWESSDPLTISVTLRYDWATMITSPPPGGDRTAGALS